MTLAVENPFTSYSTDGVTSTYPLGFSVSEASDVQAMLTDAAGVASIPAFSVSGGNAVFSVVPAAGGTLVLTRATPVDQLADFSSGDSFASGVADAAFDRITRIIQDLKAQVFRVPAGEVVSALAGALARVNTLFAFGANGQPQLIPISGFAGPPGGNVLSIGLFIAMPFLNIPLGTSLVQTSGNGVLGVGDATYIEDAQSLAIGASAPNTCAQSANGRWFRLLPQWDKIKFSQAGGQGGSTNDQPALQAAIEYCKAITCQEIYFDFPSNDIWCTPRTSNAAQNYTDAWAQDGQPIWVTAPLKFTGPSSLWHLRLLSVTGTSLETGWQNVGGNVWRGSGINLIGGPQALPNANNLSFFAMENVWLDGGCAYTGVRTAVTPASPDGPDLTNKGLRLQDTHCGAVTLTNCVISGFKGEAYYCAGTGTCVQIITNCTISGSNQSAFNPSSSPVYATNCNFGNSFIAIECLGGIGGRLVNCKFYNSLQLGVMAGQEYGGGYNYAYPNRDVTKAPPWFDLVDCEFDTIGQLLFANYVRVIGATVTDCAFTLSSAVTFGALTSTYIDADVVIDQMNQYPLCVIQGPPNATTLVNGAPPGGAFVAPVNDLHIRFNIRRTALAKARGYFCLPFADSGLIDQDTCTYAVGDSDGVVAVRLANYGGGTSLSMPLTIQEQPTNSQLVGGGNAWGTVLLNASGSTFAIPVSSTSHVLVNTGAPGTIACTMTNPFTAPGGYANGQTVNLYGNGSGTTWTFARNAAGLRLNSDCALTQGSDVLRLQYHKDTGLWYELGGRSVYTP